MDEELIARIRKDCRLCAGYRLFRPNDTTQRDAVVDNLNSLQQEYTDQFERLRRQDDTSDAEVAKAKQNKYFAMDLISVCRSCNREIDQVNRQIVQLTQAGNAKPNRSKNLT